MSDNIQSPFEEKLNAGSHVISALLSTTGLVLLIVFNSSKTIWSLLVLLFTVYLFIVLFTASTLYHVVKDGKRKHYYRILDHISIYVLIAGTYTPVSLITLTNSLGWVLLLVV